MTKSTKTEEFLALVGDDPSRIVAVLILMDRMLATKKGKAGPRRPSPKKKRAR